MLPSKAVVPSEALRSVFRLAVVALQTPGVGVEALLVGNLATRIEPAEPTHRIAAVDITGADAEGIHGDDDFLAFLPA